jgi:hypothetical protein
MHLSHNMHHAFHVPHALEHPYSLLREPLAHIPRFSLSVAVLQVEYMLLTQVLLQSFPHTHFCLFIPVAEPHPSVLRGEMHLQSVH